MKIKAGLVILLVLAVFATGVIAKSQSDLIGTLSSSPDHKTLVKLVKEAGLTKTLQGAGPYTIFAPTDAAFAKIPKATRDSLMKPENKAKLKSILLYHVIKGKVTSKEVMGMKSPSSVVTVNGAKLQVTHTKSGVMVNDAKVSKADMMASNGVVHSIDKVLMPPAAAGR